MAHSFSRTSSPDSLVLQHSTATSARISPPPPIAAFAESISVRPGEDQGGYEIRLQTASVYRVRGIVLDGTGSHRQTALCRLFPVQPSAGEFNSCLYRAEARCFLAEQSVRVQPAREPDL